MPVVIVYSTPMFLTVMVPLFIPYAVVQVSGIIPTTYDALDSAPDLEHKVLGSNPTIGGILTVWHFIA